MRWRTAVCSLMLLGYVSYLAPGLVRFEFTELHMGTRFKIVIYAATADAASLASSAAFERIARLDATMSDYSATSELMLLCKQEPGTKVAVSEDLFRVLIKSQELAKRSNGAFDITVGPLVMLWRRARRTGELPDRQRLLEALESTGHGKLYLDPEAHAVRLDKRGMLLDLGGIAKGYAADEAMMVLKRHGLNRSLVAAGGDIAVGAPPPGKDGWVVGISELDSVDAPPSRYLVLQDSAISTSGDANQNVEIGGVRYSHIVDPRSGVPLTGRSSVTVVAPDCATSDGLATAASVLGPEGGGRLVDSTSGAAALFVRIEGEATRSYETNLWKQIRKTDAKQAFVH